MPKNVRVDKYGLYAKIIGGGNFLFRKVLDYKSYLLRRAAALTLYTYIIYRGFAAHLCPDYSIDQDVVLVAGERVEHLALEGDAYLEGAERSKRHILIVEASATA